MGICCREKKILYPTNDPSVSPSKNPIVSSINPTIDPTINPTFDPTIDPITDPTVSPTYTPSLIPTLYPTEVPSINPTLLPTYIPTVNPTYLELEGEVVGNTELSEMNTQQTEDANNKSKSMNEDDMYTEYVIALGIIIGILVIIIICMLVMCFIKQDKIQNEDKAQPNMVKVNTMSVTDGLDTNGNVMELSDGAMIDMQNVRQVSVVPSVIHNTAGAA